ncbi:MAG: hypothetical protein GY853_13595 [PVC group bacterium]|nr:hypothetical protein [PVC group bacterium]
MISIAEFSTVIKRIVVLNNLVVKKDFIDFAWDKLKYSKLSHLEAAAEEITTGDTDAKFTYKYLRYMVRKQEQKARSDQGETGESHWDGTECNHCDIGLIFIKHVIDGRKYTTCLRCSFCSSYHANIAFLKRDEIAQLERDESIIINNKEYTLEHKPQTIR